MIQLSELVNLARKKGLSDKAFDRLYMECDRDYQRIKEVLESMEGK